MRLINNIAPVLILALISVSLLLFPPGCTRVSSGGFIDISSGSVVSSASDRVTGYSLGNAPIETRYSLSLHGMPDGSPSVGSASAYMDVLIQEGNNNSLNLVERIEFSDFASISGRINRFERVMSFRSGLYG